MPTVPYEGAPRVSPDAAPSRYITGRGATEEAFGSGVSRAMQSFGQQVDKFGDVLARHEIEKAKLDNDATVNEMVYKWQLADAEDRNSFRQLAGAASQEAMPNHIRRIEATQRRFRDELPNDEAKRSFDAATRRQVGHGIVNDSLHAATEQRKYRVGSAEARLSGDRDRAARAANDDKTFHDVQSNVPIVLATIRKDQGWDDEQFNAKVREVQSKNWEDRFNNLAISDPVRADQLFKANRESIPGTIHDNVQRLIKTGLRTVASRDIAEAVTAGRGAYNIKVLGQESKYDDYAKNPASSATGAAQFIWGTWQELMRKHPELGLTADGRTDRNQVLRALEKYNELSVEALNKENLGVTEKHMYMLHFMGQGGGTKFLKALRDTPIVTAASEFPEAAASNRNVFYTRDGRARSIREVYDLQTRRFSEGMPGLSADLTTTELNTMIEEGRGRMPSDDIEAKDMVEQRIRQKFSQTRAVAVLSHREAMTKVGDVVLGDAAAEREGAKSIDAINGDPATLAAWNNLTPQERDAFSRRIDKNNEADDIPLTVENQNRYRELLGESVSDPAKFLARSDIINEDLTKTQRRSLLRRQDSIVKETGKSVSVAMAEREAKRVLEPLHITSKSNPQQYNQFVGALTVLTDDFIKTNKKPPSDEDRAKMSRELLREVYGGSWNPLSSLMGGEGFGARAAYQIPPKAQEELTKLFKRKYARDPTPQELFLRYRAMVSKPNG